MTTDSYDIDATRGFRSRFTAIIEDGTPKEFHVIVKQQATRLSNAGHGRPSDAASQAVRDFWAHTLDADLQAHADYIRLEGGE